MRTALLIQRSESDIRAEREGALRCYDSNTLLGAPYPEILLFWSARTPTSQFR